MQSETADFAPGAATWLTRRNILVVSGPFALLCENMTSCTCPEVHNILHRRQRITDGHTQATCKEHLVKFGRVISRYASGQTNSQTDRQTDKHTDTLIAILHTPTIEVK